MPPKHIIQLNYANLKAGQHRLSNPLAAMLGALDRQRAWKYLKKGNKINKRYFILVPISLMLLIACNKNVLRIDPSGACDKEKTIIDAVYPDFITASRNLDINYLNRSASNEAQRKYSNALQLLMNRQTDSAEARLS